MGEISIKCLIFVTFSYVWQFVDLKDPSPLVYGGVPVRSINDAPFNAVLVSSESIEASCSAIIIHYQMLLSAANCYKRKYTYYVVAGTPRVWGSYPIPGEIFDVKKVVVHPGYNGVPGNNDVCVIVLKNKFKYSSAIQPIKMAGNDFSTPKNGANVTMYGYGRDENSEARELRWMVVPFLDKCPHSRSSDDKAKCVDEAVQTTCEGDDGGPVVYNNLLLGVISAGPRNCALNNSDSKYTFIPYVREFIDTVLKMHTDIHCKHKMVGGIPVEITDAPFMASYQLEDKRFTCAATIVHQQFLVSAAHCLLGLDLSLHNLSVTVGSSTNYGGETYAVKEIYIHPYFNFHTYDDDIAMLQLKTNLKLNSRVQVVNLTASETYPDVGYHMSAYGFAGQPESEIAHLSKLALPYYNWGICHALYAEVKGYAITARMFCAGDDSNHTCAGNNGGPLIYNNYLYGIASFGRSACLYHYPSVFTYVPHYVPFINYLIKTFAVK